MVHSLNTKAKKLTNKQFYFDEQVRCVAGCPRMFSENKVTTMCMSEHISVASDASKVILL